MSKPKLQHRHYVFIASIITGLPEEIRDCVAGHFGEKLLGTNPQYDESRFFEAAMGRSYNWRDRQL